tara:strand:+ start:119298 stop:119591 length:294 start_codon:yes stop_codon:yes gene_type:complete
MEKIKKYDTFLEEFVGFKKSGRNDDDEGNTGSMGYNRLDDNRDDVEKAKNHDLGELEEMPEPIGKFIMDNAQGKQMADGMYYHYADVCNLLRMYKGY